MSTVLITLPVTPIYVEDEKIGGYTVFFKEFPNIISEGETKEDALDNIIKTVHDVFKYKKTQSIEELDKF
jgi:predicted RNase H-like HicB family nuclease